MPNEYDAWVGKSQEQAGCLSADRAAMLHATLETGEPSQPVEGNIAPYLWHWSAFAPTTPMSALAADGHEHRGGFLPPVPHPRRMWAGGSLDFHAPVIVGRDLRQTSSIAKVERKSSSMVFVTVEHEIFDRDTHLISERHNIVYLDVPPRYSPPKPRPVPEAPVFVQDEEMPITRLFRYSAATFNAHRIHYDLSFARDVEGYPGLLVHGPLQATLMLREAIRHTGRTPKHLTYRGVHPMFHDDALQVMGYDETPDTLCICTVKPRAHQGMIGTVTWTDQ